MKKTNTISKTKILLFNHATKEQYGSLIIDGTKDKLKISKGWDKCLEFTF